MIKLIITLVTALIAVHYGGFRSPLMTKILNEHVFKKDTWGGRFFDEYWIFFQIPGLDIVLVLIVSFVQYALGN